MASLPHSHTVKGLVRTLWPRRGTFGYSSPESITQEVAASAAAQEFVLSADVQVTVLTVHVLFLFEKLPVVCCECNWSLEQMQISRITSKEYLNC